MHEAHHSMQELMRGHADVAFEVRVAKLAEQQLREHRPARERFLVPKPACAETKIFPSERV